MKNKNIFILATILLSCIAIYTYYASCHKPKAIITKATVSDNVIVPEDMDNTCAVYSDPSKNIKEMKQTTSYIIYGKVKKVTESSSVAVKTTVDILETYKGNLDSKTIEIKQIGKVGEAEVLEEGKSYILFLNENGDDEATFFIRAGIEGVFEVDLENKKIFPIFEKWNDELATTFNTKQQSNKVRIDFDKFINYIKQN